MTEEQFKEAIAEFADKPAHELTMTEAIDAVGIDSISMFEFLMKLEDIIGEHDVDVTPQIVTLQDLYDAVADGADSNAA
ncbi:acyl carrier protein [Propionimicrobium sp. PCR01-08-3]|uniref:acyl carrier protein n=1 Tax=Propionimicrobium sp. PCR01-08-3 TaxID=3052086 RepID=UPI00255C9634|nr:acyl carrier protein [Propionimicrobium sp. PCR01-08-3]WIY83741.1 acyl carrier protein [Propionimicrobium sp. PCR01-08-3]